jgi:DNA-binding beta-propeller fold protein YncE
MSEERGVHAFSPYGMTVSPSGKSLYVSDLMNHVVMIFRVANGSFVSEFGGRGDGKGQFNFPYGIDVNSHGNVIVADRENNRISVHEADGTFCFTFGDRGSEPGQFQSPMDVAINWRDDIVVSDLWNHRIQVFDRHGQFLAAIGNGRGSGSGQLNSPYGLAIGSHRRHIFVADFGNHRVVEFDQDGKHVRNVVAPAPDMQQIEYPLNYPSSVCVDKTTGNIIVADSQNDRICIYSDDGTLITTYGSRGGRMSQFRTPMTIAILGRVRSFLIVNDKANKRLQVIRARKSRKI